MISSKILLENLDWLEQQFQKCSTVRSQFDREIVLYPRYAVLEACGWLEMTVDDILCNIYKNKVGEDISNGKKELYINNIWGLNRNNFERIFSNIVGYANFKKIQEGNMKSDYSFLSSFIFDIFEKRNDFAHTYLQSETEPIYKTPKIIKNDIIRAEKILNKIEKEFIK